MYTTEDLLALGREFDDDPTNIGYPAGGVEATANDVPFAALINEVRPETLVKRTSVSASQIAGAIDPTEHEALSEQQARWLRDCVLTPGTLDAFRGVEAVRGIRERFPSQTRSGPAIESLLVQPGNRLTQMYQEGLIHEVGSFTTSTPGQIRAARAAQAPA